jgi:hypothetical protein
MLAEMDQLGTFNWVHVMEWQIEVGLLRGVRFNDRTGMIAFEEPLLAPHEAMIYQFTMSFAKQFDTPWDGTPKNSVFDGLGYTTSGGKYWNAREIDHLQQHRPHQHIVNYSTTTRPEDFRLYERVTYMLFYLI